MGEPVVDHPRLGLDAEVVGGELAERPAAIAVRSRSDLKDERLTALLGKRAEVVVHVVDELEVDECLGGRRYAPLLLVRAHAFRTQHVARVAVDRDHRVQGPAVLPIETEEGRGGAGVVPSRHSDGVRRRAQVRR